MKGILGLVFIALSLIALGQSKSGKKKNSYEQGTLYFYWGYNRSAYTKSNMRFTGPGYDFSMKGARAHDNPSPFDASIYFNPKKITIPQFNVRMGYYFKNFLSLSLGYDHMKYIFKDGNEVYLSGKIDPTLDAVWSGTYQSEKITTNRQTFHYENSDGLNYIRLELSHTMRWLTFGKKDWLAFSSVTGIGTGGLLSFNDFDFAGEKDMRTISLSGYAFSAHLAPRIEFFRHFFIQPSINGGFMHQVRVRTRPNDPSSYARHSYGYVEFNTVAGIFLYLGKNRGCDSCPVW